MVHWLALIVGLWLGDLTIVMQAHGDTDGLGGGMFMAGDRGKRGQRSDLSPQCALPNGLTHPGAC